MTWLFHLLGRAIRRRNMEGLFYCFAVCVLNLESADFFFDCLREDSSNALQGFSGGWATYVSCSRCACRRVKLLSLISGLKSQRSVALSFGQSPIVHSIARLCSQSLTPQVARSFSRPPARSLDRSIVLLIQRSSNNLHIAAQILSAPRQQESRTHGCT